LRRTVSRVERRTSTSGFAPHPANAQRVRNALIAFGAPLFDLTIGDLSRPDIVFQIGVPPNRIDTSHRLQV
jgi:hypothetical protein